MLSNCQAGGITGGHVSRYTVFDHSRGPTKEREGELKPKGRCWLAWVACYKVPGACPRSSLGRFAASFLDTQEGHRGLSQFKPRLARCRQLTPRQLLPSRNRLVEIAMASRILLVGLANDSHTSRGKFSGITAWWKTAIPKSESHHQDFIPG